MLRSGILGYMLMYIKIGGHCSGVPYLYSVMWSAPGSWNVHGFGSHSDLSEV